MFVPAVLYQYLQTLKIPNRWLIAYSGGVDSHVLLQALAGLRVEHPELLLRAVHVNHGLHPDAAQWSLHCEKVCQQLAIECVVKQAIDLRNRQHRSLEELAREQRYQLFAEVLQPQECVLTAHTQDDQSETLLLQILRGAGVKGLAAMPAVKPLISKKDPGDADGLLVRPLLAISRQAILAYARNAGLQWIEDDSNACLRFDRNYLRHQVLPVLSSRWPAAKPVLARVAEHCAEASELLEQLAAQDWQLAAGSVAGTLAISALNNLSFIRQKNLLRFWLRKLQLRAPSTVKLQQLLQDFLACAADANPQMQWPGVEVRRFADDLYAFTPLPSHDPRQILPWDGQQSLLLPGIGVLTAQEIPLAFRVNTAPITVRFRQGGERFRPQGRQGSHPLKKLMQEWAIPPWLRDRVPLIFQGEE